MTICSVYSHGCQVVGRKKKNMQPPPPPPHDLKKIKTEERKGTANIPEYFKLAKAFLNC
jgi:hypothetical protein